MKLAYLPPNCRAPTPTDAGSRTAWSMIARTSCSARSPTTTLTPAEQRSAAMVVRVPAAVRECAEIVTRLYSCVGSGEIDPESAVARAGLRGLGKSGGR
ncbi:hypothetical protein U1707_12100 [Sphingomonas sp. PB2P12]|uniref:hypothetical protein n=1 Tax=Sphingomonas sandaracina TaxID=3096157 RepID=UPI002FCCAEDA